MMQMSPSQRSAEDIQRLKARAAKRGLSPGPGAYSPQAPGSIAANYGLYAFKSSVQRIVNTQVNREQGDPGSYEPQIYLSLVRQATSSCSKSAAGETPPEPNATDCPRMR